MIILKLSGGLGNQLFDYAYGRWCSKYFGEELVFDCSDFKTDELRDFSLQHMNIPDIKILSDAELDDMKDNIIELTSDCIGIKNGYKMLKSCNSKSKLIIRLLINRLQSYYVKAFKKHKIKLLEGFYQSEYYFRPINEKVVEEFRIITQPSEENVKLIDMISKNNSVCVHIRLGDYLEEQWSWLQVCTAEYYYKAMQFMNSVVDNPTFYVFSNTHEDIEYIKNNFKFEFPVEYVDLNNPDYEELRLMTECKHFIISNSTFSWWAQYLAKNQDKVVVAPKKWEKNGHRCEIYQDHWILM